jgi:hypothetical protein
VNAADLAIVITAAGAAVTSTIAAWRSTQTHKEVKTLNAKTIGVLAGEQETRRISDKPLEERTPEDQRHLLDIPPERPLNAPTDIRDKPIGG